MLSHYQDVEDNSSSFGIRLKFRDDAFNFESH